MRRHSADWYCGLHEPRHFQYRAHRMRNPRLLLFDIDGTMLLTHGIGRTMLARAFRDAIGREVDIAGIPFSGRTDQSIARDIASRNGVEDHELFAVVSDVLHRYESLWTLEWESVSVEMLPGVADLVTTLAQYSHVDLALVTGNVKRVAYHKLRCIGMDSYFPAGGFGCDSPDRNVLPAIAVSRMRDLKGLDWTESDVVVIGDTPRDVRCAREINARVVAVCTGYYDRKDLESAGADLVLNDLSPESGILSLLTDGLPG